MNKKRNRASAKVHRGAVIFSFCIALFGFAADAQDTVTYNKAVKAYRTGQFETAIVELKNLFFSPKASAWQEDTAALLLGDIFLKGREGVPAQPIEGYLWLLRAAQSEARIPEGKPDAGAVPAGKAISILNNTFDPEDGLVKNPAAQRAWIRMALEALPADWLKETIDEATLSAAESRARNHEARRQLGLLPADVVESRFLEAKQNWLQTKPAFERPFGILFGYDYPHELAFNLGFSEFKSGVMHYRNVKVYDRFGNGEYDSASPGGDYSVFATPKSAKVFQVSAALQFASPEECMLKQRSHVTQISEGADLRELASCNGDCSDGWTLQQRVWQVNGPPDPLVDSQFPLRVDFAEEMAGTRVRAKCMTGGVGEITFIHLPSLELQRAELLDVMSDLNVDWFEKTEAGEPHASLSPFGIRLVAPLAKSIRRLSTDPRPDVANEFRVSVNPPQKQSPFQAYGVELSPLTETVLNVWASAAFKSRDDCRVTMEATVKEIVQQHDQGTSAVFRADSTAGKNGTRAPYLLEIYSDHTREEYWRVSPFYVTLNQLSTDVGGFSYKDRSVIKVQARCDQGRYSGWLQNEYGRGRAEKMWALTVRFAYPWGNHIAHQEACALDPTRFDCNLGR